MSLNAGVQPCSEPGQLLDGMAVMALLGGRAGQGTDNDGRITCGSKILQRASVPYAALQISCLAASGLIGTEHNNDLSTFPADFTGRRNRLEDSSTDQADGQCSPFGTLSPAVWQACWARNKH